MEDAHCVVDNAAPGVHAFATFDGHRGAEVAIFAAEHLPSTLPELLRSGGAGSALRASFHLLDTLLTEARMRYELLCHSPYGVKVSSSVDGPARIREMEDLASAAGWYPGLSGSTALVALVDVPRQQLVVANAGDSRAVLCREGRAVALSTDHKPSCVSERRRIEAAGSSVMDGYVSTPHSFGGRLAVSRGLGDREHKLSRLPPQMQAITAEPELCELALQPEVDEFVLLACDGVWDVLTSDEAVACVRRRLAEGATLTDSAEALVREAFDLGSTDNMTALLFRKAHGNDGAGVQRASGAHGRAHAVRASGADPSASGSVMRRNASQILWDSLLVRETQPTLV